MEKYEVLKRTFGYDGFRPGQEELIDAILEGRDVLGIMPTGAGKSLCYQVPALLLSGITLVISPLISLMMDQVKALNQAGVHAAYINSSLTEGQVARALFLAGEGRYKIIYVAPERLETESFLAFADRADLSMVTVDEAHCISQWGQDFRPSYLKIVRFINRLAKRPVVSAFTATATQMVRDDIGCVLGLREPKMLVTGFDRQNLFFEVRRPRKKDAELFDYVSLHSGESGIIYCATRKNVENVCAFLEEMGIDATKYHAGLSGEERKRNQEDFIYDRKPVMIATNAFGMGIDKSNVRYVVHYNMPQSMENYYQEAGRAGRDGEPSECVILYSAQDVMINKFLIERKGENQEFTGEELRALQENDQARLRAMSGYCTTRKCLRHYILNYFGERTEGTGCGSCSNCLTQYEEVDVTDVAADVVRCIRDCGQRYGVNVITGVLRGENKAKLRSYGLTERKTFGLCKGMSEERLKEIINEMLSLQHLTVTPDKYMLLRLGETAADILAGTCAVRVKCLPQGAQTAASAGGAGKGAAGAGKQRLSDILTSRGLELFDRLREKRLEIAREEAVPPYIVFSDKTLTDMCIKVPLERAEMLNVSGVGENKLQRYGDQFLDCIRSFCGGERLKLYYGEEPTGEPSDGKGGAGSNASAGRDSGGRTKRKEEFVLTEEIAGQLHYSQKTTLSDLVGQMNDLRDQTSVKRITVKAVMGGLLAEGYVREELRDGYTRKTVTEKGAEFGIFTEVRTGKDDRQYEVLLYTEKAQRALTDMLQGRWKTLMLQEE